MKHLKALLACGVIFIVMAIASGVAKDLSGATARAVVLVIGVMAIFSTWSAFTKGK